VLESSRLERSTRPMASHSASMSASGTRVFSSSLTSRRFPALRTLTAEDVEVMVMQQQLSSPSATAAAPGTEAPATAGLFSANTVKPSAADAMAGKPKAKPSSGFSASLANRPPFRPNNASEGREMITDWRHGYVGLHSPYDMAHRIQLLEREENQRRVIGDKYDPVAWSKARKDIEVNYFLNSPDAETIEAERRYIKDKAARNMVEYYRRMHAVMEKKAAAAAASP